MKCLFDCFQFSRVSVWRRPDKTGFTGFIVLQNKQKFSSENRWKNTENSKKFFSFSSSRWNHTKKNREQTESIFCFTAAYQTWSYFRSSSSKYFQFYNNRSSFNINEWNHKIIIGDVTFNKQVFNLSERLPAGVFKDSLTEFLMWLFFWHLQEHKTAPTVYVFIMTWWWLKDSRWLLLQKKKYIF